LRYAAPAMTLKIKRDARPTAITLGNSNL